MLDPRHADCILMVWLTLVGAAVGSFLNVVVYRLPLGMSLVKPPSHCPTCKHPIRWFDNVPVLGWIVLRGRCRYCGSAISIRYPVVEGITAVIFGWLASWELLTDGANLPRRLVQLSENSLPSGFSQQQLYGVYFFHLLLLCTLLCTALIEIDGRRPPLRLFLPALLVGSAAPLAWPLLRPVPVFAGQPDWLAGAVEGLVGLSAGLAVGACFGCALRGRRQWVGLLPALSSVGVFLGWQAVGVLAIATSVIYAVSWLFARIVPKLRQMPASVWLLPLTFSWILFWARLVARP